MCSEADDLHGILLGAQFNQVLVSVELEHVGEANVIMGLQQSTRQITIKNGTIYDTTLLTR